MACKINLFFRLLFSLSLVLTAIKGYQKLNDNKGFVSQNLRFFGEKISVLNILFRLRVYSGLIITIENYLLIFTACCLLFKFKFSKVTGIIAILIELLLVHNPIFYREDVYREIASQYLALLGGTLLL